MRSFNCKPHKSVEWMPIRLRAFIGIVAISIMLPFYAARGIRALWNSSAKNVVEESRPILRAAKMLFDAVIYGEDA